MALAGGAKSPNFSSLFRFINNSQGRADPAAPREGADHLEPARLNGLDEIVEQPIDHMFVKDPLVAKPLQIELERLQFHAQLRRRIGKRDRTEVRLARLRAQRGE